MKRGRKAKIKYYGPLAKRNQDIYQRWLQVNEFFSCREIGLEFGLSGARIWQIVHQMQRNALVPAPDSH